jgi:tryptophan synthase alpha chain
MTRIEQTFQNRPAFIGYLTLGDGGIPYTIESALALVEGGVDLLELGIPFSDPVADGPVIQAGMKRSLEMGTKPEDVFEVAAAIRARISVPMILFSYYNPILQAGESFIPHAKKAGIDGVLIVDLPLEECHDQISIHHKYGLDSICIATPATTNERLEKIVKTSQGFVYYACQKGTTGMRNQLPGDFQEQLTRIKSSTDIPVAAGFGIGDKSTAKDILKHADGFIVGSAFVKAIAQKVSFSDLRSLVRSIDPR